MTTDFTPDAATRAQIAAADPSGSVWLSANAGSGKTRVLTDRVAWLLLEGTPPERILCLTYTKAAAGEMQNRLFARLGDWAMLSDDELRDQITRLGAGRGTIPSDRLRHARTLFARAIETPGGLKIQTIHAFCASLLRRFPLEAGVTPAFAEMDETATARLHAEVLDKMGDDPATRGLVDAVGARLSDTEPAAFLSAVGRMRDGAPPPDEAELRAALGIRDADPAAVLADVAGPEAAALIDAFLDDAAGAPGKALAQAAATLAPGRGAHPADRFAAMCKACLTASGTPRKTGNWPKAVREGTHGPLVETFEALIARAEDGIARIGAFETLEQTLVLHAFAPEFVERVETRKRARGWLDFDDQIARTRHLLSSSSLAQWVLFKLDGGIDHILVDEAQDTAPDQWQVIVSLLAEFAAGAGARPDIRRTAFVVGDRKQSIYAFQGADLAAFDRMRDRLTELFAPGPAPMAERELRHSFRSSPVILDLVDAVFVDDSGLGPPPRHIAFQDRMPGRIDLWPALETEKEDVQDRRWYDPVDRRGRKDANVALAGHIATAIERMIADRVPVGRGTDRRAVEAGDILILLQRRRDLFHHIVRACKARGLDLAGADRLRLSDDMAVRDLIATLTWVATPADDLSLATVLRSPLGATDEAGLFALAHKREGRLWDALRMRGSDPDTQAMLADLLAHADFERPYELLQRILVVHDGRRRLLARLGAEAAEAIDALLAQALAYEQLEVPSLTGFLGWLASADVEVKRQGGKGSIRVMTVHGAKGLEAPVVILPETMTRRARALSGVFRLPDGPHVWAAPKAGWSPALHAADERARQAEAEERDRLLYVGLTRAENWLIVGAAGTTGEDPRDSWHGMVEAGMQACGARPHEFDCGTGLRLELGNWSPGARVAPGAVAPPPAFDWHERPAPPPARAARRLAPSTLPGPKTLPGEGDRDGEAARRHGTAIHALLEHLPGLDPTDWARAAPDLLRRYADAIHEAEIPALLAEARSVLLAPEFAHVFAPGTLAELPFALPAEGVRPAIVGTIDRVLLDGDTVTIVDFKSNVAIPDDPARTPSGILAQMGAYRRAAETIWPDRTVRTAILWTKAPLLMDLPHDLVTGAWAAIDPAGPPA
ncbi:double-strand break repair helicase AddA [Jannaschia sp. S6380]|uniref:double-strand break repair helicase AddA n=1 Tax=Jannaschia sp. S6380 TaxID=2926408 RepID=UPI001FF587EA|nr:double-strand break repair helicase AddA [Jannaschia sp. S6380]MCK0168836.1 double-strand break repair helicase AddA [Jannaschia sp. S6380]